MSTFEELYHKYTSKTISEQEAQHLFDMIAQEAYDDSLRALLDDTISKLDEEKEVSQSRADQILTLIIQMRPGRSRQIWLRPMVQWMAAAVLLIVAGSIIWLKQIDSRNTPEAPVVSQVAHEILPAQTGAVLTLADGYTIILDSLNNGVITRQSGTTVTLTNNKLIYNDKFAGQVAYNTLSTPRGRLFNLVLPDGSKVWLNTESSIRYPTHFTGKERVVELAGEAYFEVAHNKEMPFRVKVAGITDVEVLGTRFNINAYGNEDAIKTTLLQGRVRIHALDDARKQLTRVLHPGQQSTIPAALTTSSIDVTQVDTAQVMAWKNGIFNFENANIKTVMRQLERWYNIEVAYEKGVPDIVFGGKMGRDLTLQQVLRILEISNVRYRIDGNKLVILQ